MRGFFLYLFNNCFVRVCVCVWPDFAVARCDPAAETGWGGLKVELR